MTGMLKKNIQDILFLTAGFFFSFYYPISQSDLAFTDLKSVRVLDRQGLLLRELLSPVSGRGRFVPLSGISDRLLQAAVVVEDQRFYDHIGIDPLAIGRAARQNLTSGKIVSGASTITQQVIRNIYHPPRIWLFKVLEAWQAIRLEHTLTKSQILEQYFNRIPFGNQTFGVFAASEMYLGKQPQELSWAETAFLISIPKSPALYNPHHESALWKDRQKSVLQRLFDKGCLSEPELQRALVEHLSLFPKREVFHAPHFVDHVASGLPDNLTEIQTSLDLALQKAVEKTVSEQVLRNRQNGVTNSAVLVADNRTGQILAMVGSANYFDDAHDGQFNAVYARRQPGSTLKPFTYLTAFEGSFTPATLIADVKLVVDEGKGVFTPRNYDNTFHGPVRARIALACSYNVSAVRVLQEIGVKTLLQRLLTFGFTSLDQPAETYGHGLTLGNGEVTLAELVQAYAALANQGKLRPLTWTKDTTPFTTIADSGLVYLITDILSDDLARSPAFGFGSPLDFPFPCAAKTGTSSDFRDNWTIGYTTDFTVGVWVGNFDNTPMTGVSGITGAGPIFRDVMMTLYQNGDPPPFHTPVTTISVKICTLSGALASPNCPFSTSEFFLKDKEPDAYCTFHKAGGTLDYTMIPSVFHPWIRETIASSAGDGNFGITYPNQGLHLKIDPHLRREYQVLTFTARVPRQVGTVNWFLNDKPFGRTNGSHRLVWPIQTGTYRLKITAEQLSDEVEFEVDP